jgi:hypothetical protein
MQIGVCVVGAHVLGLRIAFGANGIGLVLQIVLRSVGAAASMLSATFSAFASILSAACSRGVLLHAESAIRPAAALSTSIFFIIIALFVGTVRKALAAEINEAALCSDA